MASVDVSVSSDLTPEQAWKLASNLHRFNEWLTIFGGWKSPVPDVIEKGTEVSSCIKVKGISNVIHWQVTGYDAPQCIEMRGRGRGGVRISLTLTIRDDRPGTTFHLGAVLAGPMLGGPLGVLVARVLRSDVRTSVQSLATLDATTVPRRGS